MNLNERFGAGLRLSMWEESKHPRGQGGKFGAGGGGGRAPKKSYGGRPVMTAEQVAGIRQEQNSPEIRAKKLAPSLEAMAQKVMPEGHLAKTQYMGDNRVTTYLHDQVGVYGHVDGQVDEQGFHHVIATGATRHPDVVNSLAAHLSGRKPPEVTTPAPSVHEVAHEKKKRQKYGGRPVWTREQFNAAQQGQLKASRQPLYLSQASDHGTITLGPQEGWPTKMRIKIGDEERDVPVTYLEKDVIEVGNYTHPITKQRFGVTEKRIDHWAKNVNDMNAAGLEIPTPIDHAETQLARAKHNDPYVSAADNLGFVVGARRVGNRLRLTHQVIGEDALVKAMRNRASIYVLPEYVDERGRKWDDCIVHSAYTPMPVVSGMGAFLPIAASRDGGEGAAPVFTVARESQQQAGESIMALSDKQMEQIRQHVVANSGVSVEEAAAMDEDALIEELFKIAFPGEDLTDANVTTAAADVGVQPVGLSRAALAAKYVELKEKLALSRQSGDVKLDDELAADRLADCDEQIDALVKAGKIKPTQATTAKAFLRSGDKPNKLMLARTESGKMPARLLIDMLGETEPVRQPGEKTGAQDRKLALARDGAGGDDDATKKVREKAEAYGKSQNRRKTA